MRRSSLILLLTGLALVLAMAAGARSGHAASAPWKAWWGQTSTAGGAFQLASQSPSSPGETHSALLTSAGSWSDVTFSYTATTLKQLRRGSAPNPWEVAWSMFRFRDLANYYYFILKPNGYELGKKQGSDAQIFLATGNQPRLAVGQTARIQIRAAGPRIRVSVNGAQVLDFTDPHPLPAGAVGLYEEDSQVRFGSVGVTAP